MIWIAALLMLLPEIAKANPARKIVVQKDQIVTVRTALGIATIVQVPDQPVSVVLGDAGAFKVEYLDQAITIKPLHRNATSNLYVHTDYNRFSLKLVVGPVASADYIVYLAPFREPTPKSSERGSPLKWKIVGTSKDTALGKFRLTRIAKDTTSIFIEVAFTPTRDQRIDPGIFWLTQNREKKPIQDLLLSAVNAKRGEIVTGVIVVRRQDLTPNSGATVEIRTKSTVSFQLEKGLLWKN